MLYHPVFVNIDRKAITETLKKIGRIRLEKTCEMRNKPMPTRTANFKLICDHKSTRLYYKYEETKHYSDYSELMLLKKEDIPIYGWQACFGMQAALRFNE